MAARERVFQMLWRPEILLLLMLMAVYGIIGELSNPGAILPGVVGAIALILVLYMATVLPVNIAGLALIGLAVVLFIIDIYAPTHGVLTFGGIVSFFLGALMLFNRADPAFRLCFSHTDPLDDAFRELAAPKAFAYNIYGAGNGSASTIAYDAAIRTYTVDPDGAAGFSRAGRGVSRDAAGSGGFAARTRGRKSAVRRIERPQRADAGQRSTRIEDAARRHFRRTLKDRTWAKLHGFHILRHSRASICAAAITMRPSPEPRS